VAEAKWTTGQLVVIVLSALAIVGLLGYARGEDGDDGRATEPQELHVYVEVE
jgi:hypothetical protein